jgi:hypothetical protein
MLSPLLPSNKTLTQMKGHDFNVAMDAWTEAAMSPPFVDGDLPISEQTLVVATAE